MKPLSTSTDAPNRAAAIRERPHHDIRVPDTAIEMRQPIRLVAWSAPRMLNEPSSMPAVKNTTSVNSQNTTLGYGCHKIFVC
ncbi:MULTISPECIES: hypothetical protein [Burkholderia]|uniref:hypothetical protein n=1 Tax=Burkholderia TaxID=32008 RepID=UPI0011602C0D|nr:MULTISPECIES: hypothetical protein [Burkholderia]